MKFICYASTILSVLFAMALGPCAIAAPIEIAEIKRDTEVDFEKEILPVFRRNCLACHSATEAQGDLVLESPQMILKGGGEGPAVVAGKSGESRLLRLASQQKEPLMPPPDNDVKAKPLTPQELGLIKLWIDQGAKGEVKAASTEIAWQPLPPGINPIYAVAITANGQYAAASRANQIFLVHVPSKRELGRLTDPALLSGGIYKQPGVADLDLIQSLKFSPDGTWLASGGFRTVKLWHKTGGNKIADMSESDAAAALGANDASKSVRPGDKAEEVKVATGTESKTINHGSAIAASAASADGKRVVTIGTDGSAKLWDVAAGKSLAELKGDLRSSLKAAELTRAAALAKKHTELAKKDLEDANGRKKAEEENKTKATDALTKSENDLKPKEEAAKKASEEKSAADKLLADVIAAKTKSDEAKKVAEEVLAKSDEALKAAKVSQEAAAKIETDEGKIAKLATDKVTAEIEALLKLLDSGKQQAAKTAEEAAGKLTEAEKKAKDLAAAHQKSVDEEAVAKRNVDTAKRGVERANEAVKKATEAIPGFESLVKAAEETAKTADDVVAKANAAVKDAEMPVRAAAFSPDDLLVATVGDDGAIHTWDAASGAAVEVYDAGPALTRVAFVDRSHVVVVGKSGASKWAIGSDWKLERTIGSPSDDAVFTDRVTALDFSPDGKTLAVGSGEPSRSGQIKLFDVTTGAEKLAIKEPHSDTVNSLVFSPDGKQLASCAADRFVKLWNVADGKHVRSFEGHTHHVLGVAWRPDGRALVSSGADMVLKIWDARTGDQLRTVQNQFTKEVTSVAFITDELVLASGGDSKVRAINSANGNSQRDFSGTSDYMYSVAASADGKTILAGGLDSILRIWNDQGQEIAKFAAPPRPLPEKTAAK
ncbi:MAG TPA: c-type cytochrome domain-containing protein [Pirellulaceae bacterium]